MQFNVTIVTEQWSLQDANKSYGIQCTAEGLKLRALSFELEMQQKRYVSSSYRLYNPVVAQIDNPFKREPLFSHCEWSHYTRCRRNISDLHIITLPGIGIDKIFIINAFIVEYSVFLVSLIHFRSNAVIGSTTILHMNMVSKAHNRKNYIKTWWDLITCA